MNARLVEASASHAALGGFRLHGEAALRAELEAQYGRRIEQFMKTVSGLDGFEDAETPPGERQFFLAEGVRLSPVVAPHLYDLARRALDHLHIEQEVEFYIYRTDVPDAFCSYDRDRGIFSVCVSPEYINILDNLELLDLLGHEIGHAVLDHVQNKFLLTEDLVYELQDWEASMSGRVLDKHENRQLSRARSALGLLDPAFLARCRRLARLQELSADRFGLLCSRDVGASLISHMKELTGGLSSRFITYDAAAVLRQLEELDALDRDAINLFDGTHPITAVRMKSLMLFEQSEGYARFVGADTWSHGREETDRMVGELLRQTERFPSRPSDRALVETVTAGAIWVLLPDRVTPELRQSIEGELYRLTEYSEIPPEWVQPDRAHAREAALAGCGRLAGAMTERELEDALRMTVELASAVGRPAPRFRVRAQEIGEALKLSPSRIESVLHEKSRSPAARRGHGGARPG